MGFLAIDHKIPVFGSKTAKKGLKMRNKGIILSCSIDFATLPGNFTEAETATGYTWIDDKPIYRRVIKGTSIANNNSFSSNFSHDTVIDIHGVSIWQDGSGTTTPISWISAYLANATERCDVYVSSNGLTFRNKASKTVNVFAIVYYTKS